MESLFPYETYGYKNIWLCPCSPCLAYVSLMVTIALCWEPKLVFSGVLGEAQPRATLVLLVEGAHS
jgi:hypothetical protein